MEQQIARGRQNLLLVDPSDLLPLKEILAGWRDERDRVQAALDAERSKADASPELDEDAILAELDHLEEFLAQDSTALAKAAFGRIFKSITLFWKQVSPRRRELVRAEIETRFPFCLTGNTLIRVPDQTKREPDVVQFKTTKETHVDGILATLSELYQGRPVTSVRIGQVYGMGHHQVLIYLHMAKSDGRAKPVFSNAGGVIRGWVPADAEVRHTLAEERAINAAETVKRLFAGKPVATRQVARELKKPVKTVRRWLNLARDMELIRKPDSQQGWILA